MRLAKFLRYRLKQADWWLPPAATSELQSSMIAAMASPVGNLLYAAGALTSSVTSLRVKPASLFAGVGRRRQ